MNKKRILSIVIAAVILLVVGLMAWQWFSARSHALPDHIVASNARLEMGRTDVATLYAGRIAQVMVHEGDTVEAGQALAKMESAQVTAQLDVAQAAKQRAQAAVTAQQQKLDIAALDLRNTKDLHRDALVSGSELEKRTAQLKGERAGVAAAQAAVAEADAQINRIKDVDQDMTLCAPIAGRVEYRLAEPGEVVAAGARVVSLLDPSDVSMSIFLPVETMAKVAVGADARIRLDGLDVVFPAKVSFIAAQAQFTPKYVETKSEREKLMYRVKLTISSDIALKYQNFIKGGLTGTGYVNTDAKAAFPSDLTVKLPQE